MLADLTAKEFREWEHYATLEPFDETRDDYRIASIVQMLYNINRGKDQKPISIEDAVLKFGEPDAPKPKQTWQDKIMVARLMAQAAAGDVKNK